MPRKHIEAYNLPEAVFETMLTRKQADGFGNDPWETWFTYLAQTWKRTPSDAERRRLETGQGLMALWLANFADNLNDIREGLTLRDLPEAVPKRDCALVVGRGPSLFKQAREQMPLLRKYRDKFAVVSTDGASKFLLQHDVIPDVTACLDGNRDLIRPFFEGPEWDKNGKGAPVVLTINVAHNVYERLKEIGAKVYWMSSIWDDFREPDSLVKWIVMMTAGRRNNAGIVAFRVGSNVGEGCFCLAYKMLHFKTIVLLGMDMGYPEGTRFEDTAYWKNAKSAGVGMLPFSTVFTHITHPQFGNSFVDPVFLQYRTAMLDLFSELKDVKVVNCTGGGSLFGEGLECMSFREWCEKP